jgi:hypothetical protein
MLDFIEIPLGFNLLWKRLPLISRRLRTQRFKGLNISRESRWTFGISGSMYYSGTDTSVSVVREDSKTRY